MWLQFRIAAAAWLVFGAHSQKVSVDHGVGHIVGAGTEHVAECARPTVCDTRPPQEFLNSPFELHQAFVALEQITSEANTARHREEKTKLLRTLTRNGKWGPNHPRHRLLDALWGFSRYYERQKAELERLKKLYKSVSKPQKTFLERHTHYLSKFGHVDHLLAKNQELCNEIVQNALAFYDIGMDELQTHMSTMEKAGKKADKVSVSQALKHFVRDWTEEGEREREPFDCILTSLNKLLPRGTSSHAKILLPGAGLGRLGYQVAKRSDFEVVINEWSTYMIAAYRFLETHRAPHAASLHPFVDNWSHHVTTPNMHRQVSFPDVPINASAVLLAEGDFTTAFSHHTGHYDVVITYFFIDTARNLMSYLDTIHRVLKPGGHWINFGPLLYGSAPFVQLTLEEIVVVTQAMGFEYLETEERCGRLTMPGSTVRGMEGVYQFDERALTKSAYEAQFWVARRGE